MFAGYAVVTAGMAGSSITVDAYSAATGSTVSQVNLQLTAPAQAGVRLQVSVASYSVVPASAVVGIAGQSYQFSQVVDAMTPSTGVLPVTISCSTPVSGFYSSGVTVTVSWSYPGVVVAGDSSCGEHAVLVACACRRCERRQGLRRAAGGDDGSPRGNPRGAGGGRGPLTRHPSKGGLERCCRGRSEATRAFTGTLKR